MPVGSPADQYIAANQIPGVEKSGWPTDTSPVITCS
jgi:hypothetical protein